VDAVDLAGTAQFLLAHKGKVSRGSQVGLGDLARLASGGGDQVHIAAFSGVFGQGAAGAEGFVVGMGKNGH
jgi:hypothetical protein